MSLAAAVGTIARNPRADIADDAANGSGLHRPGRCAIRTGGHGRHAPACPIPGAELPTRCPDGSLLDEKPEKMSRHARACSSPVSCNPFFRVVRGVSQSLNLAEKKRLGGHTCAPRPDTTKESGQVTRSSCAPFVSGHPYWPPSGIELAEPLDTAGDGDRLGVRRGPTGGDGLVPDVHDGWEVGLERVPVAHAHRVPLRFKKSRLAKMPAFRISLPHNGMRRQFQDGHNSPVGLKN